jgi:RHH-type proline utilization regulon transcriptional repressor/proline dehydrogenase/delta 1-pyrroline-5-carboxylate dehydrogenase
VVLQVQTSIYEPKTQEIAKQLLTATQENRSFLASLRDQMRWDDKLLA